MFLKIFILFFNFGLFYSQCQKGCLKCSQDNTCILCDSISGFIKEENTCKKINMQNCVKMNLEGNCLICKNNTFIDPNTYKCVEVSSLIQNCELYQVSQACMQCKNNFYMEHGLCFKVPEEIQYCKTYQNSNICSECLDGYILQFDQKKCIQPPFLPNCKSYTYLQCNGCKNGYQLDHNLYFREIFKFEDNQSLQSINNTIFMHQSTKSSIEKKHICQKIQAQNCATYENYQKCKTCRLNYFMNDDGICQEFPQEQIHNCQQYRNEQECIKCSEGFYLENAQKCSPIQVIENCILYDNTKNQSYCSECSANYFSEGIKCTLRVNSLQIEQCAINKNDKDECQECQQDYLLTGDSLKCLPKILNCQIYNVNQTNKDSAQFQCTQCNEQYYYDELSQQCVKGNTSNCKIYQTKKDECKICQNKYYLEGLTCVEHTIVEDCEVYSQSLSSVCEECNFFSKKFQILNQCLPSDVVQNCIEYSSQAICTKCKDQYYLQDNICQEIPIFLNCKNYNGVQCEHCNDNHVLLNGKCYKGFNSLTQNCYSNNIQTQNDLPITFGDAKCLVCTEGFIPKNFQNDFMCLESIFLDTPIVNCQKYDQNNNCLQCEKGYFLKQNECVQQCQGTIRNFEIQKNEQKNQYFLKQSNICIEAQDNCQVMSVTTNKEQVSYKCTQCDEEQYIQVIDPNSQEYILTKNSLIDENNIIQNPLDEYQHVQCIKKDQVTIRGVLSLDSNHIINCQYYHKLQENIYGCYKCKMGYRGILNKTEGDEKHYIESCEDNIECDNSVKYIGLLGQFEKLVSCFECLNKNQKVFIPFSWDFQTNYPIFQQKYQLENQGFSQFCSVLEHSQFSIPQDKFKVPENCAFYGYNTSLENDASSSSTQLKDGADLNKMKVMCLQCLPKFAAVYYSEGQQIPVQCNLIQNCQESNWLNNCSVCEQNHTYIFTEKDGITYDKCIKNTIDQNCLVLNLTDDQNPTCYKCKKQYFKNQDGICEQTVVPNCENEAFGFVDFYELSTLKFQLWNHSYGCAKCNDEFYLRQLNVEMPVCIQSSYLRYQNFKANSKFILNCSHYEASLDVKCSMCRTGYVLSQDQHLCYNGLNLENCKFARDENFCQMCKNGFVSIQGKCQIKSLSNCEEYSLDPQQTQQICLKCSDLYYLEKGKCIQGELEGCLQYQEDNSQKCQKCKQFFHLINKENYSYCYPINRNLNCLSFSDKFDTFELECLQCQNGYYLQTTQTPQDICLPFNSIIGCLKYAKIVQENQYIYQCVECAQDYYYDKYKCKKRQNVNQGVLEYNNGSDQAIKCKEDYYLNYELQCKPNPTGIQGCVMYESESICLGCKENYYLVNNQCIFVQENSRLENCIYYENLKECKGCEQGFFVEKSLCVRVEAINCNTYVDKKNCGSCQPGYGLKKQDGITNCVVVNQPHCLYYAQSFPWTCLLCEKEYYPNHQGVCSLVLNSIPNCLHNDTQDTCQQCDQNYVLSIDRKQCVAELDYLQDKNCTNYKKLKEPICSLCNQGHFFENGKCVMCRKYTVTTGCFTCDPYDQNKCLLCKPGYYQNEYQECVSQEITIDEQKIDQEQEKYVKIIKKAILMLFFVF